MRFKPLLLVFLTFLMWGCSSRTLKLTPATSVPAANGNVKVGQDSNHNTTIDMTVQNLARPQSLTPPASAYVVWAKSSDQPAQNQGQLRVDENLKGEFKTTVPYKDFDLFVTSENSEAVTTPTGQEVLRQHVSR